MGHRLFMRLSSAPFGQKLSPFQRQRKPYLPILSE